MKEMEETVIGILVADTTMTKTTMKMMSMTKTTRKMITADVAAGVATTNQAAVHVEALAE